MTDNYLKNLLDSYREEATSKRDQGTFFEHLAMIFLTYDPVQSQFYTDVKPWRQWAFEHGWDQRDFGIDLVAKLRNENGYAAIQCKFYAPSHRICKDDIDSFISASGKEQFRLRVIIETTEWPWTEPAEEMIRGQNIPVIRIGLRQLLESPIQWEKYEDKGKIRLTEKKYLREHQKPLREDQREALKAVQEGLAERDRGKLIMACGTGKTLISLRLAEEMAGEGKQVLFLVPSLALIAQVVHEWAHNAKLPLSLFAVCSDKQVGKRSVRDDDTTEIDVLDLVFPATTDAEKLARDVNKYSGSDRMTVVFATYQSIQVIADAQQQYRLAEFELIICDEAHRTTGATRVDKKESYFVKVHSNDVIRGKKRLYMTATPRIFSENVKAKAKESETVLTSMDDEHLFGETLFYLSFSEAVRKNLLTDFKLIVLAMDENLVSYAVQRRLADSNNELVLDDATKIIGCYKALAKVDLQTDVAADPEPMRRALAFCGSIKSSELICKEFESVVDEFLSMNRLFYNLRCEFEHVDGTFNARTRGRLLDWLEEDTGKGVCRLLSNVRCLTEGVDLPTIDAIIFLHPRKSQVDVVQSVGRVMRRAEGKKMGYVILPVGVPAGIPPNQALDNNEKYRVIWQIVNALRAHDEDFKNTINKMSLGEDVSDRIQIIRVIGQYQNDELQAVTTVVNQLPRKGRVGDQDGGPRRVPVDIGTDHEQRVIEYVHDEFGRAVTTKIVEKCGTRDYWEDWAVNVAAIAQRHITRLNGILKDQDTKVRHTFDDFLAELQEDLNDKITAADAIEMLSQHIVTRPIFAVLFEGYRFTSRNSVSRAMQSVLDTIDKAGIDKESRGLGKFYQSVVHRATDIKDPQAKQALIKELYDKFFRGAFPRTTKKLGIAYTPIEVVDFIIHSVNDILQEEFGETLSSRDVHIIDPFTGTGTFITRLLQSGLIRPEEMEYKFRKEIHANEIVLLAYYIAAINIETVYHSLMGGNYTPFEGICLTDTFQMYESDDLRSYYMFDNSARRKRQKKQDIRVIIGNPPYSTGQKKQDDEAKNVRYSTLDNRIKETYVEHSSATLKRNLYDSYIRAIRWASDRIGESGVVGFITNNGWIEKGFADGLRKCLAEEFTSLYVIDLRGDVRKNMISQSRAGEGEGIFGSGSMTGTTIALFVKNPTVSERGQIFYHDIGDNLKREQKLSRIANFRSITGIREANGWTRITPNRHGDWINPRIDDFGTFLRLGYKEKEPLSESALFAVYSMGVITGRDAWCCNYSHTQLTKNIARTIAFYNTQVECWQAAKQENMPEPAIHRNPKEMSWTHNLEKDLKSIKPLSLRDGVTMLSLFRPFTKQWLYFSRRLNERVYQMPQIFPEPGLKNRVIAVTGVGAQTGFSCLIANDIPNIHFIESIQCFPLWQYTPVENDKSKLGLGRQESEVEEVMATSGRRYLRTSALTVQGMNRVRQTYTGMDITEEDVFFYVYGLLHSEEYRTRFVNNLFKELARIPLMRTREGFEAFREAGKALAYLHTNYESIEPYPVRIAQGDLLLNVIEDPAAFYRVTKMKFGGGQGDRQDKSTVIYNHNITMLDIPLAAYEYIVDGKSAVEWVMTRQGVKTDKDSGIVKDANCYAIETVGDPSYPFSLFCRIIRVSLETMKIVRGLPDLDLVLPETN